MSQGIAEQQSYANNRIGGGDREGRNNADSCAQRRRGILAAKKEREDRAEESAGEAEGHDQEHDDGGSDGHTANRPCSPGKRRKLIFQEVPKPFAGLVYRAGRRG